MNEFGFLSILPSVIAILLALRTKQVYLSLLFGVWLGCLIISGGNVINGTFSTFEAFVDVFRNPDSARTILFISLVGALIIFIQRSGGVQGFVIKVSKLLDYFENKNSGYSKIIAQILAWLTGMLIFVETSISVLTVGALYKPVFDKLKISKEKLAYIADTGSSSSSILIPLNAWGAFIMGLLLLQGFDNPFNILLKTIMFNFYPILALTLVLVIILLKKDFGPMKKAEERVQKQENQFEELANSDLNSEVVEMKEGIKPRAINMILPIIVMVGLMPVMLIYTGYMQNEDPLEGNFITNLISILGKGSGSKAVLYSVSITLIFSMIMYRSQKIMGFIEMTNLIIKGISKLIPISILMILAFSIGNVCKTLGTGEYIADVASNWLSPSFVPVIVFMISCFIAFSTGSSWGTYAIIISICIPIAQELDANIYLTLGAALGGGIFGDHCSPISDTTILSSMATSTEHTEHVKTQLPYALFVGSICLVLYLVLGFIL